jgi:hypothetical protein
MSATGWKQLLAGWPWFRGEGRFPVPSYSESMPPPYLVRKPYGGWDLCLLRDDDPRGWPVTEHEEALTLQPGLESVARQLLRQLVQLGGEQHGHAIAHGKLVDNPYWSLDLARQAAKLPAEPYVLLLALALSRTLDDKGRVRWTLFGGSEQGPARPFWRGFFTAPHREVPAEEALPFFRRLLHAAYDVPDKELDDLHRAGLRVLPQGDDLPFAYWDEGPLPSWTAPLLWEPGQSLRGVRFLLTFRPFLRLPAAVRRAYLAGDLHLLPFPGSLLFWGCPGYLRLERELTFAVQVPLLQQVERHEGPLGLRVPQAGWMHEAHDGTVPEQPHGPVRGTFKRTHRTARVRRDEDELATAQEDKVAHVLFSAAQADVGLYYKPMARNAQMWAHDFRPLLDGPRADYHAITRAADVVKAGGMFGYRFVYPAMRLGRHELYWHRPLVAYHTGTGQPAVLPDAPTGYLTAYRADRPDLTRPVELWPRLLCRDLHAAALELYRHLPHRGPQHAGLNIRKLLDTWQLLGERPLPRSFARQLLTLDKDTTLNGWLASLGEKASDPERGRWLAGELRRRLEPEDPPARGARRTRAPASLTYRHTARRSFEVAYWKTIAFLSAGNYQTKNNADPIQDEATEAVRPAERRDLDALGRYLLKHYAGLIDRHKLAGKALAGEMPFPWETIFHYPWMGGWQHNREGRAHERNVVVVIPGRDRRRAVLMADHYDTAYMEDYYMPDRGGTGARVAAPGADDNCSATTTLMLAAPVFLELSRAGKLGCDIWLVHLTGEEYPADGLGARQLCQCLVEGRLRLEVGGEWHDLSDVAVKGLAVLDMVAHNTNSDRDVFQIAPGTTPESMWLAYQAHVAAATWNASLPAWNARPPRRDAGRGRRSRSPERIPPVARHLHLHGEVRPTYDPRSTLYNTDGDEFSDAGLPTVLFMENYDINRMGYHDSEDDMRNINLDYGAAVAAITIEAVARMATEERPGT